MKSVSVNGFDPISITAYVSDIEVAIQYLEDTIGGVHNRLYGAPPLSGPTIEAINSPGSLLDRLRDIKTRLEDLGHKADRIHLAV